MNKIDLIESNCIPAVTSLFNKVNQKGVDQKQFYTSLIGPLLHLFLNCKNNGLG